jgi:hypothetical protein
MDDIFIWLCFDLGFDGAKDTPVEVLHVPTVGRYVLQMENYACNVTFYVTLSASYRYLYFSYDTLFTKGATSILVMFPSILCKTRLRYFFTKFG